MTPTLLETWAEKMPPDTFHRRGDARRTHRHADRPTAAGWLMLATAIALWLYLGAHVAWWAIR